MPGSGPAILGAASSKFAWWLDKNGVLQVLGVWERLLVDMLLDASGKLYCSDLFTLPFLYWV